MTDTAPVVEATPDDQAAADAALDEALNSGIVPPPPGTFDEPRRNPTLSENFVDVAILIADVKKKSRLSEATLIKAWELGLMWALNNRQSVEPSIYPTEDGAGVEEEETPPTEIHEQITAEE